ncbi:hypothetical protein B0A58_12795 [Flavobacterium branchiophilum NBRC 15030 = ATCC 35035]|uniref:hypothetical protein n=1 Tax=Flavobacterium branchiophilum TaxID=55197 RepID=UPI000B5B7193|nr:hypothetical protein [Flavobacterium branchiophilum]OXA72286.1 hypothetical protein B0A58_12795 [Flavobacterium branchiophilum NBRC 15030 = ATCC 35035]
MIYLLLMFQKYNLFSINKKKYKKFQTNTYYPTKSHFIHKNTNQLGHAGKKKQAPTPQTLQAGLPFFAVGLSRAHGALR